MNEQILKDWKQAESAGLVRLKAEPEQEDYFSIFGEPEGYETTTGELVSPQAERKQIEHSIDLYGNWWITSEYFHAGSWHHADSIGMCAGYKNPLCPAENCYIPDLMQSALNLIPQEGEH